MGLVWLVPIAGIAAILLAVYLIRDTLARDKGTPEMQDIAARIVEGANAFLRRQYMTIGGLAIVAAIAIGVVLALLSQTDIDGDAVVTSADKLGMGWRTAVAFLVGAICSGVAGYIGMFVSVRANLRTAAAAARGGIREAVAVAMRGGAVSGFLIVALSMLGVTGIYYAYSADAKAEIVPFLIVGFGFGASFVALFAQLGGGIYTKAADMGADLVGKVEAGIPEDDPRNAGVIADLVGDNVGDCAGRGADLFESTAAESIGAMILGVAAYVAATKAGLPNAQVWILFPVVMHAFGLLASMAGVFSVRAKEDEDPMNALNRGFYVSVVVAVGGLALATFMMLGQVVGNPGWLFGAGLVGIATSIAFVYITRYYTEGKFRPVQDIIEGARTGPGTSVVAGTAVGFETTMSTAVVVGAAIWASFWLGGHITFPDGSPVVHGGLFGIAVATMGMLMTAAYVLAMDAFGPITDNASGIVEMSGAGSAVRAVTDRLDAVGNTTKALTKGYAMGSAGLAAFLLFSAYLDTIESLKLGQLLQQGVAVAQATAQAAEFRRVDISVPTVFIGALLGAMLIFLFSSMAMRAVGRTASAVIDEVRRQFREIPGLMEGKARPDYARCVDITARAGLREMIMPGILAVSLPIVVGVVLKAQAVAGFLMVGTIVGMLLATYLNNAGGAWDNAKKTIETGTYIPKGAKEPLKKGSAIHAAAVVGDTVGDPFKDTAGPALHVLVKLLATITLVMAPLFL
ncbi:MAG: sodium-translocating pyrophosphatase [Dehalococcoidia bacterium]|nr:sodium-translocating pyrophosphatase [Dehalococcoidia bacterium]